jgi:hypothetical protein
VSITEPESTGNYGTHSPMNGLQFLTTQNPVAEDLRSPATMFRFIRQIRTQFQELAAECPIRPCAAFGMATTLGCHGIIIEGLNRGRFSPHKGWEHR